MQPPRNDQDSKQTFTLTWFLLLFAVVLAIGVLFALYGGNDPVLKWPLSW